MLCLQVFLLCVCRGDTHTRWYIPYDIGNRCPGCPDIQTRKIKMDQQKLNEPATANLMGAGSVADMAAAEGFEAGAYVIGLSDFIRCNKLPLANQRDRLQALAQSGARGDLASANALSQHFILLESLMHRFSYESTKWAASGDKRGPEYAERLMGAAIKAHTAAARCLSALKILRDAPSASGAPTPTAPASESAINTIAN